MPNETTRGLFHQTLCDKQKFNSTQLLAKKHRSISSPQTVHCATNLCAEICLICAPFAKCHSPQKAFASTYGNGIDPKWQD